MYISDLALKGFKSFAHNTEMTFDQGITAIVGPNGCGKSNIVDAMRWVLGEQRPTLLRSSSMTNVIFNGTAQKKQMGLAEVSLTFINNKGLLPTEYSEVTITRRLDRSGSSDYLINGTDCRLKDITALFMDTGMSSDAYSVIELKMVEEILTNKNNDRRRLFEEAAGITGYKEKRKKTLRKLENTRDDLQRVEDVLSEIRKNVRSLERQAGKARKSKKYSEELDRLDKALSRHKYQAIQDDLEPLKGRIDNAETEKKDIAEGIGNLEQKEEKNRALLNEKEQLQADAQKRLSQITAKKSEAETDLQITQEKISTEENIVSQYADDIAQDKADLEELRELLDQSGRKLDRFNKELETAKYNLGDSREKFNAIQRAFSSARDELDEYNQGIKRAENELNKLQNKRIRISSRIENTEQELERLDQEEQNLGAQTDDFTEQHEALKKELQSLRAALEKSEEALEQAQQNKQSLEEQQNVLKDELRALSSRRDSVASEIDLLQGIANSNEAFPSSVTFLVEQHDTAFDMLKVVSDVLSTDQRHAVAMEAALDHALNFLVVRTIEEARRGVQLLKEHDKGQATFIPLEALSDDYDVADNALVEHISCDESFLPLAKLLLGQVLVVDKIDDAFTNYSTTQTVVTLDGEVVTNRRFLQSGSKSKNAGMRVGLADKIASLEEKQTQVTKEIDKKEQQLHKTQQQIENINLIDLQQSVRDHQQQVRSCENKINSLQSKVQVYRTNAADLKERREGLKSTREELNEALKDLAPRREELESTLDELQEKQQKQEEAIASLEEERSIAQSRYNDARLKHQNLENKVENHERDVKRAENGITNLKERLNLRSEKRVEAKQKIAELSNTVETLKAKAKETGEQKEKAAQKLIETKEAAAEQRGIINKIEKALKEARRQKEVNMDLMHHLTMAREKFEMQATNISDRIWETYETLMDQIDARLPEDMAPDKAKERISWLRQKLNRIGEVNALAIEEFEEEKERLDLYEDQIEDLETARSQLIETIDEINKTATERFNKTFKAIRRNFQDVFHTLFNDDDFADLTIEEDAEDPLEAKIEIEANPRGKRPSTINQLSGGEKTLTAIALLFAIYLVKPSPFCVLDEVDAPLDDANIERFSNMIRRFSEETQFIIITHNKKTMAKAEMMYGVTMPETGISRLVGVKMDEVMEA